MGGDKGVVNVSTNFNLREINNRSELKDNEHLVEIVAKGVLRETETEIVGGDSQIGGKYIRINSSTLNEDGSQNYSNGGHNGSLTHEFGHTGGLIHPFEFFNNKNVFIDGTKVPIETQKTLWDNPNSYNTRNNFMDYSVRSQTLLNKSYKELATNPGKANWGQVMSILMYYKYGKLNHNDVQKK